MRACRLIGGVALAALLLPASRAAADIVKLTNGRTITVESCRFDGDTAILLMPGGGEIRVRRELVDELLPDEVPYARATAVDALASSPSASLAPMDGGAIRRLVDLVAARVGVDRKLAHAVVRTESNYEPLAVSRRGAMGLMQIMPLLVRHYELADPFDPERNLEAGMRHLRGLLLRFDVRRALAAYNAGETAVARYGGVPPYRETQNYVRRIMLAIR